MYWKYRLQKFTKGHKVTKGPKMSQKVQKVTKGHKKLQKAAKGCKKSQKVAESLVYIREKIQKVYILSQL